jgi:hypothetical protein
MKGLHLPYEEVKRQRLMRHSLITHAFVLVIFIKTPTGKVE